MCIRDRVDRVFSRVGASDNLAEGRSTFMVEMEEAANILHNSTEHSLVILDEVGRGTSTYDGVSIAWALAEFMLKDRGARTLFATHYHELTRLAEDHGEYVQNLSVAISEQDNELVFLRKIVSGGADKSYGIHVAKMAGVLDPVIKRANDILTQIEGSLDIDTESFVQGVEEAPSANIDQQQLGLYVEDQRYPELKEKVLEIDLNNTTPIELLSIVNELQKDLKDS